MVHLSTWRIAVLQLAYPAVAIVIDRLFLSHPLGGLQVAGMALMSLAIAYASGLGDWLDLDKNSRFRPCINGYGIKS